MLEDNFDRKTFGPTNPVVESPGFVGLVRLLALGAALLVLRCSLTWAVPRIPDSDATVLEHVPAASAVRALEPLRARLARNPQDVPSALALAQGYLDLGRANADPRFVSYAQATLAPWMSRRNPPPEMLILEASAAQYLHRFDEALTVLDQALRLQPQNGQAWLIKATILQVRGRFDAARQACRPLARASGQLIALTCLTGVDSLTGRLQASYSALHSVFRDDGRIPLGIRLWIFNELADMAERAGDDRSAELYYTSALRAAPQDSYTKGQYADLLLRQQRSAQVVQFLRADTQQDNLLLRLAIAGHALHDPEATAWGDAFQARFEAARRDGDDTHLREQARFLLAVRGRAPEALELARRNWQIQKEPADVRLYVAAARGAGNSQSLQEILVWVRQTHYEDRTLEW